MLTPSAVANAKPREKAYKMADGGGLFLLVNPNGRRWWRWKCRRPDSGKENLLSLGVFPDLSLRQARERRDEARKLLADGVDPGVQREAQKQAGAERAGRQATHPTLALAHDSPLRVASRPTCRPRRTLTNPSSRSWSWQIFTPLNPTNPGTRASWSARRHRSS